MWKILNGRLAVARGIPVLLTVIQGRRSSLPRFRSEIIERTTEDRFWKLLSVSELRQLYVLVTAGSPLSLVLSCMSGDQWPSYEPLYFVWWNTSADQPANQML